MLRFLLSRAIHTAAMLALVSVFCFGLASLAPGSFHAELALDPQISPETLALIEARDAPGESIAIRYARWAKSVISGRLGFSMAYHRPVAELLFPRVARTLILAIAALAISWPAALLLGLWSAAHPGSFLSRSLSYATSAALSVPELLLCLLTLYGMARAGILSPVGKIGPPLTVLVVASWPLLYRHVLSAVTTAAALNCVEAARMHGIRGIRLWTIYVLRAGSNPLISLFGSSIGGLVGSSLAIEVLLSWPGMGSLFLDAVASRDVDVVAGVVLLAAVFAACGNLLADLMLFASDPRIRWEWR